MTQSKQNKQAASKSEYGTLTAKMDANNDYSSKTAGTSASASPAAGTSASSANMSQLSQLAEQSQTGSTTSAATNAKTQKANQTLTAKYDANGDYSAEQQQLKPRAAPDSIKESGAACFIPTESITS